MAESGGLQLIPDTKRKIEIRRPGQNRVLIVGVGFMALFVGLGFAVSFYRSSIEAQIQDLDLQISQVESESRNLGEEKQKIRILSSQLRVAGELINSHIFWTKGLTLFESLVRPDVQLISMNGSVLDKQLDIKAKTSNYTSVARQIASLLRESAIADVSVPRISTNTDGTVEFDIFIKFNDREFIKVSAVGTPRPTPTQ